jgi:uncharacterized protein (TIGR03118 family)
MKHCQKNLTSDLNHVGNFVDTNLQNPWSVINKDDNIFWVVNNSTSLITQYNKEGRSTGLQTISVTGESPTGLIMSKEQFHFNNELASLICVTKNGTIDIWNSTFGSKTKIAYSDCSSCYTGLIILKNLLFVCNFGQSKIDVFDSKFKFVNSFTDSELIESGYGPYNIITQSDKLYICFAKQNSLKNDVLNGQGNGYIDIFNSNGKFIQRLINRGYLNSPWGMITAKIKYKSKEKKILIVANSGDGTILIYNRKTGLLMHTLQDSDSNNIKIDNLKSLLKIPISKNSSKYKIYFTAGINNSTNGLLGVINKI